MKPVSKSVKDYLIEGMVKSMDIKKDWIEEVIRFQGMDARVALDSVNSIEFSGFGKILVSPNKTLKKIKNREASLERAYKEMQGASQEQLEVYNEKITSIKSTIIYLKNKYEQITGIPQVTA